jgi:aminopeptidase YwaD
MNADAFNGKNAYQSIKKLSVDIGPRFSGSESCELAASYIKSYFEDLRIKVSDQEFDLQTGGLADFKLEILDPVLGDITCRPLQFIPDTPQDGIVGDLIYVEGIDRPQMGPHVKGKIVIWSRSGVQGMNFRLDKLFQYEPLAVLMISMNPGFKPRHDVVTERTFGPYKPVPIFQISWEDGYKLVQEGAQKARIVVKSFIKNGMGRNIIAELPGEESPEEIVIIGGHYDSPPETVSATDNASGTAIMLELARLYARRGSKRSLRFIAWDAEERGLVGSRHYASRLYSADRVERKSDDFDLRRDRTELDRHLLCINMDVLGMALGHHSCYVIGPPELSGTIKVLGKELGVPQQVITDSLYGSDHEPLAWAGVPAINFSRIGPSMQYIHTLDDTIDLIRTERLQEVGELIDTFISRNVANAKSWPFERSLPPGQAEMVSNKFEKTMGMKLLEGRD